ncbi:MAG: branched-chain amino acid ABC transporter permease [Bacillota bacterium]
MESNSIVMQIVQQCVNGIMLGSIYALLALGYTMVYGIIRLINFAHGDIFMVGAYVCFFAITTFHLPFFAALIVAMILSAALGVLIEKIAYKPLRNAPRIAVLISAIGVSLLLEYGGVALLTAQPRFFPPALGEVIFDIGGIIINGPQIIILAVSVVLMIALTYVIKFTTVGKAMRAVSFDAEAASLMGINPNRIISATFAIGSALAAAAGGLIGAYYNSIDPLMGVMPGIKAFVAAVLGGIGIMPGAMLGGVILGVVESFVSGFWSSTYRDVVAFAILIIILIVKPAGLLGKYRGEKV